MYLLITESPAKAKKIQGFLSDDYLVKSSCGHIRDLEKKKTKTYGDPNGFGIDVDNNFKPKYVNLKDKKDIIQMLKNSAIDRNIIYAADDDREGESIAWHTSKVLKSKSNDKNRIIFREISKKAIINSLKNPKKIDIDYVNSQQARRIIDRLIGFKLSPCLWKHVETNELGLSAGRVQSALLNLLEEREKYIETYETEIELDIIGNFKDLGKCDFLSNDNDVIEYNDTYIRNLLELMNQNRTFVIVSNTNKKENIHPEKPFITSSLQQTSQKRLGLTIKTTMDTAQSLYDNGHITYMRTDSTFISEEFQDKIQKKIKHDFGKNYYHKPLSKKVNGAQEAHEAIRMTNIVKPKLNGNEKRLYDLIYERTIVSHMKPAEYLVYLINLENEKVKQYGSFQSKYRQLTFPGFKAYYSIDIDNDLELSDKVYELIDCESTEKETNKPPLYDEGAIVNLLEKTGIGRPSTYSSIVSTLDNRKYTLKQDIRSEDKSISSIKLDDKGKILQTTKKTKGTNYKQRITITPLGYKVLKYLQDNFMNIIKKEFTSQVEIDLDLIAEGKVVYTDIIRKVYEMFIDTVDRQLSITNHTNNKNMRKLGIKKGYEIYIGKGKYGEYLQIIKNDETKNISLTNYMKIIKKTFDSITFEEAVHFLKYPKHISDLISIHIGYDGYYMKYKNTNYKIKQNCDGKYTEEYCLSMVS